MEVCSKFKYFNNMPKSGSLSVSYPYQEVYSIDVCHLPAWGILSNWPWLLYLNHTVAESCCYTLPVSMAALCLNLLVMVPFLFNEVVNSPHFLFSIQANSVGCALLKWRRIRIRYVSTIHLKQMQYITSLHFLFSLYMLSIFTKPEILPSFTGTAL